MLYFWDINMWGMDYFLYPSGVNVLNAKDYTDYSYPKVRVVRVVRCITPCNHAVISSTVAGFRRWSQ